jgi:hypothetical protein
MSTANYVGRTVDMLAFQHDGTPGEKLASMSLFTAGGSGKLVAGPQKLAQRWLLEFMTEIGTIPALPRRGSDFMYEARTGQFRTTVEAEQAFFLAADLVATSLRAEEDDDTPADEAYGSVDLTSIAVSGDQLTLHIVLRSAAGTSRELIMPIPIRIG